MKKKIKRKNGKAFVDYVFTSLEYGAIAVLFAIGFILRHFLQG